MMFLKRNDAEKANAARNNSHCRKETGMNDSTQTGMKASRLYPKRVMS